MRKLALLLVLVAGCSTPGRIKADSIDGLVTAICDRHDAYVKADPAMSQDKKDTATDSSAILRKIVAEAIAAANPPPK